MAGGKRLLYLEDDASTRTALAYLFEQEGFTVSSYGTAEEALDHLYRDDTDIAILDVRLPGRFGDDFGRELREKYPKTQIIFLTAEPDIDKLKQLVPGAVGIRKPVDPAVLLELLKCHAAGLPGLQDDTLPFPRQVG